MESERTSDTSLDASRLVEYIVGPREAFVSPEAMKRNAEFLTLWQMGRQTREDKDRVAAAYRFFLEESYFLLTAFPHYYRLILSMAVDLARLDAGVEIGAHLDFVLGQELFLLETSDMRRLDSEHLIRRLRPAWQFPDEGLHRRCLASIGNRAGFLHPDRAAGYHLTHVVFYFTDFGARRLDADVAPIVQNLLHTGSLCRLRDDADLLAEVCLSLHFLGKAPPADWIAAIRRRLAAIRLDWSDEGVPTYDNTYHLYLVMAWCMAAVEDGEWQTPRSRSADRRVMVDGTALQEPVFSQVCFMMAQCALVHPEAGAEPLLDLVGEDERRAIECCYETNPDFDRLLASVSFGMFGRGGRMEFPVRDWNGRR